jgi:hypothetical protein
MRATASSKTFATLKHAKPCRFPLCRWRAPVSESYRPALISCLASRPTRDRHRLRTKRFQQRVKPIRRLLHMCALLPVAVAACPSCFHRADIALSLLRDPDSCRSQCGNRCFVTGLAPTVRSYSRRRVPCRCTFDKGRRYSSYRERKSPKQPWTMYTSKKRIDCTATILREPESESCFG